MQFATYSRGFSCAATSPTPATKRIIATLDAVFMTKHHIIAIGRMLSSGRASEYGHPSPDRMDASSAFLENGLDEIAIRNSQVVEISRQPRRGTASRFQSPSRDRFWTTEV